MNWVCNNVITVYICYTSIILHLYFAAIIVLHGPKLIVSDLSQIEHQIMDKNIFKKCYHSFFFVVVVFVCV